MPQGKYISFGVFYADSEKLPEYNIGDKVYSEVNLHGPRSFFIEEDEQKYPVVPFYLEISRYCDPVVWMTIYLDGQVISNRPLFQRKFRCDGVKVQTEIRELLFSLPKIMENQEEKNPLGEFAGTIRLEAYQAECVGRKESPVFKVDPAYYTSYTKEQVLQHLTKKDIPNNKDTVGRIVCREGRPTLCVTRTGRFRTLLKYRPTQNLLEELVLYYRPRVSSHTPRDAPEIKKEKEQANNSLLRVPLGDVANTVVQQQRTSNKAPGSPKKAPAPEEQSMGLQCEQGSGDRDRPRDEVVMEAEDTVAQERPAGSLGTSEQPASLVENVCNSLDDTQPLENGEASIPVENIKTRESSAFTIPPQNIKTRESNAFMIQPENIKKRESSAFMMIKPENIKKRESNAFMMIRPENIKKRESSAFMMIPPQNIKKRESCSGPLIPPGQIKQQPEDESATSSSIKQEEEDVQWVMDQFVVLDSSDHDTSGTEQQGCRWLTDEFILVDDSSDDDDLEITREEQSIVYMGTEYLVDDDIHCMGDEDCCMLDVSSHMSFLEIDDSLLDP